MSLNKNKLRNLEGFHDLHNLEELYIQDNQYLSSVKGLYNLPKLKKLILTGSKISTLKDFPELQSLEILSLDGNSIS